MRVPQPRKVDAVVDAAGGDDADGGRRRRRRARKPREPRDPAAPVNTNANRLECHDWKDGGNCSYGANCRFLHGGEETRGSRRKGVDVCYSLRDQGACRCVIAFSLR